MRSTHALALSSRWSVALGLAGILALPARAQLLDPYTASLTTYQAAATAVQGVKPQAVQRGVGLDGSMRAGSTFSMAVAGNPFENAWTGHERQGDLRLDTGAYSPTDVDIALPSAGVPWVVGRSFSSAQKSGGSFVDSDSFMGRNWHAMSQPEIVLYEGTTDAEDVLYLVYGADRYVEYVRAVVSSSPDDQFKGRNGAAGCFDYQAGTPDLWVLTDTMGTKFYFLGFDTSGNTHNGLLWKIVDTNQNTAFVGDASTVATAISNGWDGSGRILKAYDAADRRYTYDYTDSAIGGKVRLESVIAETKSGGTWASPSGVSLAMRVDYTYYGDESHGDSGDLQMAKTTMPLTDSGVSLVKKKLYRYWEGTSDGTSAYGETVNGETAKGYVHQIKYVYESEGLRRYDYTGDANFDEDFLSASDETLKSYASAYFEHDSGHLVSKAWFNGQCGCGGSGNGAHEYTYEAITYTDNAGYDNAIAKRTVVKRPDNTYLTQYFDELGQGMSQVVTDATPGSYTKVWVTNVTRNSAGCVTQIATPANGNGYTHGSAPTAPTLANLTNAGLIWVVNRETSGTFTGYVLDRQHKTGTSGTAYLDATYTWTSKTKTITDVDVIRPLVATSRAYPLEGVDATGSVLTSYSYTAYSDDSSGDNRAQSLVIETTTTTLPSVASGNNGSGSSVTESVHCMKDHKVDYEKSGDGTITYRAYTNGQQSALREDADTSVLTEPTGFAMPAGTPFDRRYTFAYNAQGLPASSSKWSNSIDAVDPVIYRSKLKDARMVTLEFTDYGPTQPSESYYGPVRFTITNHAGMVEAAGVLKLTNNVTTSALTAWVDETDADLITALDVGTIASLSTSILNDSGAQVTESRAYFLVPASGVGVDGTNYDPTTHGYDDSGRQRRVKDASGTIRRTTFDTLGRITERWIGTNDSSFAGGESSGTDNMVKTEILAYDSNFDEGNSLVTQVTLRVEATSTGERVTSYTHDGRGRVLLETSPTSPHALHKYDNMDRRIATGLFSSTASINLDSDDPTSETTNRLALTQTFYDEMGRVWKAQRHQIKASDGSNEDNVQILTWYDEDGSVIKVDGEELRKIRYDRLGRVTDEYVLAKDNDSSYSDVTGISGDIVLEELQTRYNGVRDEIVLSVRIDRLHSDYGTNATGEPAGSHTDGKLDDNGDSDLLAIDYLDDMRGRPQISAMWYDTYGRLTDRVEYGTNGGSDFDRDNLSVPARSDTTLRTSYFYNTDGTTKYIEDPRGIETFWTYDALGRQLSEVMNWDGDDTDPVPSADSSTGGSAVNVTVKYTYVDGLRTKLTADLPSGQTDQETVYTYGTTKGTGAGDSKIGTGHLLQKVTYPDSGGAGDVVTHAYNAQSQGMWTQDQGGNVFEMDFDLSGRLTARKVTTLGSGFDGAVRRIDTVYDSLGRFSTVTQKDAVSSGTVTDEVKFSYDGWGNVERFEQDKDSTVAASSGNEYDVAYAYAKQTTGRNTLRRTSMTLPSGKAISYTYQTRNGIYDNPSSRVTEVKDNTVVLALYDYAGVGQVVGTDYTEADVYQKLFEVSTYGDLDRFNRTVKSRWTKELGTNVDFYHVELTYDRNSNITSADDSVHAGFDVKYSLDDTNRLVRAWEGTLTAGVITTATDTRDQQWTLNHTGNWNRDKVDLNGDSDFVDSGELDDTRTHNVVNELTARDTDSNSSNNYTLTFDAAGNQTDDGKDYEYVWDAFYRLRKVNRTDNQALVAEYRYNGLGFKIAVHADTDTDNDVDGNDKWYYDAFDEQWRHVARYRESDASPKEEFVAHAAGADGTSSYIDLVACRYKDANTAWTSASDGTLEERVYYSQNQHADVVALLTSDGKLKEWVKYSTYGIPFGLPGGDADSDGDCDQTQDIDTVIAGWISTSHYDVRGDVNLDGIVDTNDTSTLQALYVATTLGRGGLSSATVGNRRGFEGYRLAGAVDCLWDGRSRMLDSSLGRWLGRDPAFYIDGLSLYAAMRSNPVSLQDPTGQMSIEECIRRYYHELGTEDMFLEVALKAAAESGLSSDVAKDMTLERKKAVKKRFQACIRDSDDGPFGPPVPVPVLAPNPLPQRSRPLDDRLPIIGVLPAAEPIRLPGTVPTTGGGFWPAVGRGVCCVGRVFGVAANACTSFIMCPTIGYSYWDVPPGGNPDLLAPDTRTLLYPVPPLGDNDRERGSSRSSASFEML